MGMLCLSLLGWHMQWKLKNPEFLKGGIADLRENVYAQTLADLGQRNS
jgi:hypothetical protein